MDETDLTFRCQLDPNEDSLAVHSAQGANEADLWCFRVRRAAKGKDPLAFSAYLSVEDSHAIVRAILAQHPLPETELGRAPRDPRDWNADEQRLHRLRTSISGLGLGPISMGVFCDLAHFAARLIEDKRQLAEINDTLLESQAVMPEILPASDGEAW